MLEAGRAEIVPGESLAGVALGSSPEDVIRRLGEPEEIVDFDDDVQFYSYQSRGLSFRFEQGVFVTGFAYSGRKGGYETGEFGRFDGRTPEGVGVDASEAEVRRLYGEPYGAGELPQAPIPSRWIDYDGVMFDFIAATGELISINVGARKS
jgi:hypothetical protein